MWTWIFLAKFNGRKIRPLAKSCLKLWHRSSADAVFGAKFKMHSQQAYASMRWVTNFKAEYIKYSSALVFWLNRWKSTQLHSALNKDGGHARVYQTVFFKYLRAKRLKKFYQRNEKEQCGTHSLGCLKLCTIQEKNYN